MSLLGPDDEIQIYRNAFLNTWNPDASWESVRFVVLDCETTGLDVRRDKIITIGAVVVQGGEIILEDQFEVMVHVAHNTSSVVVHGITKEQADKMGVSEVEALKQFLDYVKDGVIVGHHIGFDIEVLKKALQMHFHVELPNLWLDTMELVLHLEDAGVLVSEEEEGRPDFSLDGLARRFHIVPHGRHTASGDAFITANLFLRLLRYAKRANRMTLRSLCERYEAPEEPER